MGPRWQQGTRALPPGALIAVLGAGCSDWGFVRQSETVEDPVVVEESFLQAPLPRVDILWVIDDTASMAEEQAALTSAFDSFADALEALGLSWQVGVISTDVSGDDAGRLRGDPWILTPDLDDVATALQDAADVGTDGARPEAGLGAAYLALTDPLRSGDNRAFRRSDASLHVIVVSDADDGSEGVLGDDPTGTFRALLHAERAATGQAAVFSAVVGDTPTGCTWEGGSALPGDTYSDLADETGGVVASICDADLSTVTEAVGEASAVWPDTFPLQAEPDPDTVRVEVDGERMDEGWTLDLDAIAVVFDEPPAPGSEISVRYEVAP